MTAHPAKSKRYQTYRMRQRAGLVCLTIPVGQGFTEALIEGGWLSEAEALNRVNLECAATQILREWVQLRSRTRHACTPGAFLPE